MKTLWSRPRRMWDRTIKVPLGFFIVLAGIAAAILLYEWGAIMYGATVQQLSLGVPLRGNVHFKYTNPRNGKSFSACLCPKCGSSSVKEWLYWSLKGHRFVKNNTAGMRLHFFDSWDVPGVHSDREPGDVHFILARDPVDRYISAYFSKIRCCEGELTPCYSDRGDHFVKPMLRRNFNTTHLHLECLPFHDYVLQLEKATEMGSARIETLNSHWRPQHILCPIEDNVPTFVTEPSTFQSFLLSMQGFALGNVNVPHLHKTARRQELDSEDIDRLRRLAKTEYEYFGLTPKELPQR